VQAKGQFPKEQTATGEFERQEDAFRDWISIDGSTPYPAEAGRYHLCVSFACPWAHRTLIVRKLLQLEGAISVAVVDPVRDERGWAFANGEQNRAPDPVTGFSFLREAYLASDRDFDGRVTVPVLWDTETRRIVNNSEDDICQMFHSAFGRRAHGRVDLFPEECADEHREWASFLYAHVNNGVYRAGFAIQQPVYENACRSLFGALERLEERLSDRRFLLGRAPVEADWRLFCTLIRFDAVYFGHFKCNMRRIVDYPNLLGYLLDLYQWPGIAETVNLDHIKRHYYITHTDINPTGIVPLGPELDLLQPHGRARL
jgi:glutathionyl-hydroquinone reductase